MDPGNVNWVVHNKGTPASTNSPAITVQVWASNDDPFAPNYAVDYATNANWFLVHDAFQLAPSSGAPQYADSVTLTNSGTLFLFANGSINYAPRAVQFQLSSCANNPLVLVQLVQASGGRS
jgi:hypothetical protein